MIKSKLLAESAWKDVLAKNKTVKDNGLLKALADARKVDDDDHDAASEILDQVVKLTGQLKKSKEVAAIPAVGKLLTEMAGAAETALRDVAKAKAEHDKAQKAKAEAEKKAQIAAKRGDEDDEEEATPDLLTTKMVPLLRRVAKGESMHALVAKAGKQAVVLLSPKPIAMSRRKMLADQLGAGGVKYYPGHCRLEQGKVTFVLNAEVSGMTKLVKAALLGQTGLRLNKVKCRGDDGDDEDEDEAADGDEDRVAESEDETETGSESEAGHAAPKPPPALVEAPAVWDGARDLLQMNLDALKDAIRQQCADEAPDFVKQVDGQLAQLDRILGKLDRRLSESLLAAGKADDPARRSGELKNAKAIVAEYIRYVNSEPLIAHLDGNPFGVKTALRSTLASSLTQVAKAIA